MSAVQVVTPCFNDWKRFCFVLREIASGENGRPLSGLEAQKRAQAVLTECGYTWSGRFIEGESIAAPNLRSANEKQQLTADAQEGAARLPAGVAQRRRTAKLKSSGRRG
jgi:hypothetical protein